MPATGFFQVSSLFGSGANAPDAANSNPRTVVLAFDSSLSMQWNKLDSSFQAFETVLHALRPQDQFNVVLFNSDVSLFATSLQPATADQIEHALAFVKQSRLRGGTNLGTALERALGQAGPNSYVVLFTDGGATQGSIRNSRLLSAFNAQWNKVPATQRPRMFVFAVGDDANLPLLKQLGSDNGVFEWARSSEPIDFKIQQFIAKIGRYPISSLRLSVAPASDTDMVYALEPSVFGGSQQVWIGEYKKPVSSAKFTASGQRDGKNLTLTANAPLPADATDHDLLPRTWAKGARRCPVGKDQSKRRRQGIYR
jgi:Ca-activated chloride channel family protein